MTRQTKMNKNKIRNEISYLEHQQYYENSIKDMEWTERITNWVIGFVAIYILGLLGIIIYQLIK